MHEGKETPNIFSFSLRSIVENYIFDPTVMMVQKLASWAQGKKFGLHPKSIHVTILNPIF
jgi:hypothetical protein